MNHRCNSLIMILVIAVLLSFTLSAASAQEDRPIVPDGPPMTAEEAAFEARQVAEALANPPPEKPALAAVESEIARTASPPHNKIESEWNGNFITADPVQVGDVIFGTIKNETDEDYFLIEDPWPLGYLLFDIDAQVLGSYLDAVLCLYDVSKTEVACSDDSDGLDSLIYYNVSSEPHYVRVRDYNYPENGGDDLFYKLSITNPLLLSAARNGKVEGMKFKKADILALQEFWDGSHRWSMFFDASDLGIKGNLVALGHTSNPTAISLVLDKKQNLEIGGGMQKINPQDVVEFIPGHYPANRWGFGPITEGSFNIYSRGADFCLTTSGEKIDAVTGRSHYGYDTNSDFVSTRARAKPCSGSKFNDEEIFNIALGTLEFDGSLIPGLAKEDIVAADYMYFVGEEYYSLVIKGRGKIDGDKINQSQIFVLWREVDSGPFFWSHVRDLNALGWKFPIDAMES